MATRNLRHEAKKDDGPVDGATMTRLMDELKLAFTAEFRTFAASLESRLDGIQLAVTDHTQRLASVEDGLNTWSGRMVELEARCTAQDEVIGKLKTKLTDVESRGRRSNIRILGLDESLHSDVLPEPPELDRCHRMPTPKPAPGSRPRAVIARLHRYRIKETIILEARKRRGKLTYKGKPILIFEDYCPEVVEQRARYRDVMWPLYQRGFKPSLQFPARLVIRTKDGTRMHLPSPKDAEDFLKTRP
ncbi:hypothetical protein NHX12_018936 [Muraenolepis orangiensis]|uniref:Transposase n=1 Tax=Muraenolepis orangiensis TaxID=630683 RepID=A0A9Q0IZ40_9TELE|nr:hypothetical protein NHX12_018936 [Muraenolepis orangiensis]